MILNIGCGGRPGDQDVDYGDVRVDIIPFPNVTHVLDAHELPKEWTNMFDLVVCRITLEHLDSPVKALSHMARVVKDDGEVEIVAPNVFHWRRILRNLRPNIDKWNLDAELPSHKQAWDLVEMRNLATQVGLIIVERHYLDHIPGKLPAKRLYEKLIEFFAPDMLKKTEVVFRLKRRYPHGT